MSHHEGDSAKIRTTDLDILPYKFQLLRFWIQFIRYLCMKCSKREIEILNDQRTRNYKK